jgi:hypothetical protein
VAAYVEEFSQLIDKLNAYQSMFEPLYYTLKFVDGLRDDVKAVVMLQRPQDLDTAAILAQLQEEAGTLLKKKEYRWQEATNPARAAVRQVAGHQWYPKEVKQIGTGKMEEKPSGSRNPSTDDRIASLYAYRKAKGLCYKCGLKYSRDHQCADTVQLHVVEELWQMVQASEDESGTCSDMDEDGPELNIMVLSQAAARGHEAPRTMKFVGHIEGMDILALLDSGSSHTFISSEVAANLPGLVPVDKSLQVQVANGSHLCCTHQILDASWSISGVTFSSTLKVLQLSTYDLIIGMDWLEKHSPMLIHWSKNGLAFLSKTPLSPYMGSGHQLCRQ